MIKSKTIVSSSVAAVLMVAMYASANSVALQTDELQKDAVNSEQTENQLIQRVTIENQRSSATSRERVSEKIERVKNTDTQTVKPNNDSQQAEHVNQTTDVMSVKEGADTPVETDNHTQQSTENRTQESIVYDEHATNVTTDHTLPTEAPAVSQAFNAEKVAEQLRALASTGFQSEAGNSIATQLVERIDSLRGYANRGFSFEMTNVSYRRVRRGDSFETETRENSLNVSVLGEESLVKFLSPARDKGRLILKSGRNMWLYIPGTSKTLRVTPAQRLIGEASNGDVTGTNFGAEYTVQITQMDVEAEAPFVEITLTAKTRSVTYSRITFRLKMADLLPMQSEYFSISGKLLKRAEYVEFKQFDNELKIHKMRLSDPITADRVTWLRFDKYQLETINPAIFNADSLSRL